MPDENERLPLQRYLNPRQAEWPQANFIVGNPPFIGNKRMRDALGDGYVEALRGVWKDMPELADLVMFWWNHTAQFLATGKTQRFGLITTNSLTQAFNRRVVQGALDKGISLAFAIPDHPWVDSADGAAVRIAMTVGTVAGGEGRLLSVIDEREGNGEGLEVTLQEQVGLLHADLRIGANVAAARPMLGNSGLSSRGVIPHGAGMVLTNEQRASLERDAPVRPYRNGRDLTDISRGVWVVDCIGLGIDVIRQDYPKLYQWLVDRVKPDRDAHRDKDLREKWWLHRRNNDEMRRSLCGLRRYIATGQTAKHRLFQFLDAAILPDDKLIAIALDDAFALGVLSSRLHVVWALATGATLEDRPVYNKTSCFDAFPFPTPTAEQTTRIRDLAEQLDAHRKRQQAVYPALTLTGMYNVLEKLRRGEALNAKDKAIHEQGLVSVLKSLHDELDAAVLDAYGWSDLAPQLTAHAEAAQKAVAEEAVLVRLVALNAERAAEEAKGHIRWLRPDYQQPSAQPRQADMVLDDGRQDALPGETSSALVVQRLPWPVTLPEQVAAVARLLAAAPLPLTEGELAARFTGKGSWKKRLPQILDTLEALGRVRRQGARVAGVGGVSGAL
ncbi:MAG: DNA methyltransferase [Candidatus Accumulibacter necessarius]